MQVMYEKKTGKQVNAIQKSKSSTGESIILVDIDGGREWRRLMEFTQFDPKAKGKKKPEPVTINKGELYEVLGMSKEI